MAREDKDAIERLKKQLYSPSGKSSVGSDIRTSLSQSTSDVPRNWSESFQEHSEEKENAPPLSQFSMTPPKKGLSIATKFLFLSVFFFIIAAGVAAYFFFGGINLISPQNIDMQVVSPSLVNGGKDTTLQVIIDNRNTSPLTLASLIINYPNGTRSATGTSQVLQQDVQDIGTIASGQQLVRTINAVFYGEQGSQETVSVTLQYNISGSNSVFQKEAQTTFIVGSSPISISINAPNEVISGQPFSMAVTVQGSGSTPVQDVDLQGEYPFGFTLSSSTPQADIGGTLWHLGTIQPGQSQTINIEGTLIGQNGDNRIFTFLSGSDSNPTDAQIATPILSVPTTITVSQPFIGGTISLNGQSGQTISIAPGTPINGTITWENSLPTAVSNVTLQLSITGAILDQSSVNAANGFYQSSNSTITWNSQDDPDLATVPAGGTGTVQFSFNTLSASNTTLYTNPTISLSLAASGLRSDQTTGVPDTVASAATAQVNVASLVTLTEQALHFTGPFQDGGPMPPVVGQNTTYTIKWTVTNSSNSLANTTVSTTLPPYIQFVAAQLGSGVTYDSASRTVTWNLGNVPAGVGYTGASPETAFQVALMPSLSQVGQAPDLTGGSTLTAEDRFAQSPIQVNTNAPTTQLTNDSGYTNAMGDVSGQ